MRPTIKVENLSKQFRIGARRAVMIDEREGAADIAAPHHIVHQLRGARLRGRLSVGGISRRQN